MVRSTLRLLPVKDTSNTYMTIRISDNGVTDREEKTTSLHHNLLQDNLLRNLLHDLVDRKL